MIQKEYWAEKDREDYEKSSYEKRRRFCFNNYFEIPSKQNPNKEELEKVLLSEFPDEDIRQLSLEYVGWKTKHGTFGYGPWKFFAKHYWTTEETDAIINKAAEAKKYAKERILKHIKIIKDNKLEYIEEEQCPHDPKYTNYLDYLDYSVLFLLSEYFDGYYECDENGDDAQYPVWEKPAPVG